MDNNKELLELKIQMLEKQIGDITKDIEILKKDVIECKTDNKLIQKDINTIKEDNSKQTKLLEDLNERTFNKREMSIIIFITTTIIGTVISVISKLLFK